MKMALVRSLSTSGRRGVKSVIYKAFRIRPRDNEHVEPLVPRGPDLPEISHLQPLALEKFMIYAPDAEAGEDEAEGAQRQEPEWRASDQSSSDVPRNTSDGGSFNTSFGETQPLLKKDADCYPRPMSRLSSMKPRPEEPHGKRVDGDNPTLQEAAPSIQVDQHTAGAPHALDFETGKCWRTTLSWNDAQPSVEFQSQSRACRHLRLDLDVVMPAGPVDPTRQMDRLVMGVKGAQMIHVVESDGRVVSSMPWSEGRTLLITTKDAELSPPCLMRC
ncbi:hypothetical protein B0I35DRAFT_174904 [Stachybotrys elegans]|uniref:Uncharacterized protein n=1 Tax=Stachybotrys elegans TaxID=80388 RepID=A0A8K0WUB3_9HYPO|nr:hypothetical protein B0I35DRAFT_174904 [Stachybotrys elegans]